MSSETCVHSVLPFNIICAHDPTLSTSHPGRKETFSLVLCPLAHTNNKLSLSSGSSHHKYTTDLHHFTNTLLSLFCICIFFIYYNSLHILEIDASCHPCMERNEYRVYNY